MEQDFALLERGVDVASLRVYQFVPGSVTYGHFIDPKKWLTSQEKAKKRPTGGGLIFHEGDFSFTLALPVEHPLVQKASLERYCLINNALLRAIDKLLTQGLCQLQSSMSPEGIIDELCMANPTQYDILFNQKKVGGSAQRKSKRGFIHQCSVFVRPLNWDEIKTKLVSPDTTIPKLSAFTGSLFSEETDASEQFVSSLKEVLHAEFLALVTETV